MSRGVVIDRDYLRQLVQGLISAADELDAVIEALDEFTDEDPDED